MDNPIRLLVVDDHPLLREGILALMRVTPDMEVVGEAANGKEAVEKAAALAPDVILMDLVMPEQDGITAIRQIKQHHPDARILVLTSFTEDDKVMAAIKAGVSGYLLKESDPGTLVQAIRDIRKGNEVFHPFIARKIMEQFSPYVAEKPAEMPATSSLTQREREVLALAASGLSNKEIAHKLIISNTTVRSHINNILNKLKLANRTQAILLALREGLVNLDTST